MNRTQSIGILLALLSSNAMGAEVKPEDKFNPQLVARTAFTEANDDVIVTIDATDKAATKADGALELDIVIGTRYGQFVQSQRGAEGVFAKKPLETAKFFAKITEGDRTKHTSTAFRNVGIVDGDYDSLIGFSSIIDDAAAAFTTLTGFRAMEQSDKYVALLTVDGQYVKFFDADKIASVLHGSDQDSVTIDDLLELGVTEDMSLELDGENPAHKMFQRLEDGKKTIQLLNNDGAIVAVIDEKRNLTKFPTPKPQETYEVAMQSGKGNVVIHYNVEAGEAQLAEPIAA